MVVVEHPSSGEVWWWDVPVVVGCFCGGGKLVLEWLHSDGIFWWWKASMVVITLHNNSALTTSICWLADKQINFLVASPLLLQLF